MDNVIEKAVRKLAGTELTDPAQMIQCEVISVDIPSRTCDCSPLTGDSVTDIPNVKLMAEVDDGFFLVPAVGSTVFVLYTTKNDPHIALFSAIDQIVMITGGSQIIVKDRSIQIHDGSYGGLIKIEALVEKINNLENLVNDLAIKYSTHTHAGVQAGSGTTAPPLPTEDNQLTPTSRADIENTEVTHGKQLE